MTNLLGYTLSDRYRVISSIGKGGMAEVYRVRDQSRNVDLAIKVLKPELAQNYAFVGHFRDEANALKNLDHPNIVRFYSFEHDKDEDVFFIVMDFVDGATLREEINASSGALSQRRILEIMRGICSALEYAHKSNYVHRDIKPTNILVGHNKVFITDFGIAHASGDLPSALGKVGTPGYMSPEQIRGERPMPASDIYSMGVLLYEMATGVRPFRGDSINTIGATSERVKQEHLQLRPPSPRLKNPQISSQLEWVILRCLEKDPAQRFSSAAELINALQKAIPAYVSKPITIKPAPPPESEPTRVMTPPIRAGRNKGLIAWAMISIVILAIAVIVMLNSGGFGNSVITPVEGIPPVVIATSQAPTPIVLSQQSFSVRPYNDYVDSGAQNLWSLLNGVTFPETPGHYYWQTDIPADTVVSLNLGWCASDESTLDANLRDMEYNAAIDGNQIDDSKFNVFKTLQNGMHCQEKAGVLSGLPKGTHTYIETMRFFQDIFDGKKNYPAGDYVYELTVSVR